MATEAAMRKQNALTLGTEAESVAPRTPIKTGGESCSGSCAYRGQCAADMVGYVTPTFVPASLEEEPDEG